MAFRLYILFIISYFLHITARFPLLGTIRFDLLLMSMIVIAILIRKKESGAGRCEIERILWILCLYILLSLPFVTWPGSVLATGIKEFSKAIAFYFFTTSTITTRKRLEIFWVVMILCQSFRILEPVYLHITQGYWGSSTFMGEGQMMDRLGGAPTDLINPNGLAIVILINIIITHYYCMSATNIAKLLYICSLPIFIYALILTASRTGLIGFVLISIFIFWQSRRKLVMTAVFITAVALIMINLSDLQQDRFASIGMSDDTRGSATAHERIEGWVGDFQVFLNAPIFGHGLGTSLEANYNLRKGIVRSHNLYLELGQELGIIGLIIFLCFIKQTISANNKYRITMKYEKSNDKLLMPIGNSLHIWLFLSLLTSLASYGLSTYHWYLMSGLIATCNIFVQNQLPKTIDQMTKTT